MIKSPESEIVSQVLIALEEGLQDQGGIQVTYKLINYLLNNISGYSNPSKEIVIKLLTKFSPRNEEEKLSIMNYLDPLLTSQEPEIVIQVIRVFLRYNIDSLLYEQVVV